jgi:hypothetical protein
LSLLKQYPSLGGTRTTFREVLEEPDRKFSIGLPLLPSKYFLSVRLLAPFGPSGDKEYRFNLLALEKSPRRMFLKSRLERVVVRPNGEIENFSFLKIGVAIGE